MSMKLRRAGSALFVVLAVGGGATTVAAGTAIGQDFGSSNACVDRCVDGGFSVSAGHGGMRIVHQGSVEAVVGDEVTFVVVLEARGYAGNDPIPTRVISAVTHQAPEGFEFTGARVTSYDWTPGAYPITALESTSGVDPTSGAVTVTAPTGGWTIPVVVRDLPEGETVYGPGNVTVTLTYLVTEPVRAGESGIMFTGNDIPALNAPIAIGKTDVAAASGGFGSSGS